MSGGLEGTAAAVEVNAAEMEAVEMEAVEMTVRRRVEGIYRQSGRRVRRIASRVLHDEHEAEDAAHDAFTLALEHGDRLRDANALEAWIYRTVRNVAVNRARRRSRSRPSERADDDEKDDDGKGPKVLLRSGSRAADPERAACVRATWSELAPDLREAARLHYVEGLTCRQVARAQRVAEGCIRTRLYRARTKLMDAAARE